MRFNKAELAALATNPLIKFDKEGLLIITERHDSFFRRVEVNHPRWCKLRGNLLFYLSDYKSSSEPSGVLVLENCRPLIRNEEKEYDGFAFTLEFEENYAQRISAPSAKERSDWVKYIQLASYSYLNRQIKYLEDQIALAMGNHIECGLPLNNSTTNLINLNAPSTEYKLEEDTIGIPLCESALSCNNLPTSDNGRLPNARIVCSVLVPGDFIWRDYACTEIVEKSSNPQFLCTINFRNCKYLKANTLLRFTVYDVKERFSSSAVPIGYVEIVFEIIKNATHFCIPLWSRRGDCSITITSWSSDPENIRLHQRTPRSSTQIFEQQHSTSKKHRRSVSLPSRLANKLFVPFQSCLKRVFANPMVHSYRLQTTLGNISIQESMFESKLCYIIPLQLLTIWILREKELLQEISCMGDLGDIWRERQMSLIDKRLELLKKYSQAKQNLEQIMKQRGSYFKRSSNKTDESFEFIPVNLHLQRMWIQADRVIKTEVLDIITVGAFTKHTGKYKQTGGLISLVQNAKTDHNTHCRVQAANDAVQVIKQIRKDIVDLMSELLVLANRKITNGMMLLSNEVIDKTKVLLSIWEPNLVEETFTFIEQYRILEEPDNVLMPTSPIRKIAQQLHDLGLKLPELEDFIRDPAIESKEFWSFANSTNDGKIARSNSLNDMTRISCLKGHIAVAQSYNEQLQKDFRISSFLPHHKQLIPEEHNHQLLKNVNLCDTGSSAKFSNIIYTVTASSSNSLKADNFTSHQCSDEALNQLHFLNTKIMNTSYSANYYRPTEDPEPLDLTQLNIEASVMCLVSKIKFLCGRIGSPAIRIRQSRGSVKCAGFITQRMSHMTSKGATAINEIPLAIPSEQNSLPLKPQMAALPTSCITDKKGNKFTDGLDLSLTTDWTSELRPSMRKLRNAMDNLLKTARLVHSVQRLQQNIECISMDLEIMYRRDVCFSQALTSVISALMAKLWGTEITEHFIIILCNIGLLAYFEGLLSLHGNEKDMWGDMCVAIEDMSSINFTLIRNDLKDTDSQCITCPRLSGSRQSLTVFIPVPDYVYAKLPDKSAITFKITPVFFNIGINEKATIVETLGQTKEQHRSNWDNFVRLKQYYTRFRKLPFSLTDKCLKSESHLANGQDLCNNINDLEKQLKDNVSKNVKILHLSETICRLMSGLRFTSCKSAKDRTGMAVTLEQCRLLVQEFQLPATALSRVLATMRSEGTRMDNVYKNIQKRKYAFNLPQVYALPVLYRPPLGCYGKADT